MSETRIEDKLSLIDPEDNTIKITPMKVLKLPPTIERIKHPETGARSVKYELDEGESALVHLFASQLGPNDPRMAGAFIYQRIGEKYYRNLVEEVAE